MPLISGTWFDDPATIRPAAPSYRRSRPDQLHPPEFNLKEADAGDTPYRGWAGAVENAGPTRSLEYLRRIRLQSAHTPEAALSQWPDSFTVALVVGLLSPPAGPTRGPERGRAVIVTPPDIYLGNIDFSIMSNDGFGSASEWVAASSLARLKAQAAAMRWAYSHPERLPEFDYNLTLVANATGAHRLPLWWPRGPSSPPAFLDPGEFRTVIAWDSLVTMPTRGPVLRRGMMDDLAFGVHIASPELTFCVTGDVAAPRLPTPRVRQFTSTVDRLDTDVLGPLPATFTFSPGLPTRIPRAPLAAIDNSLRDLPDSNEAILGAWQGQQPQPPNHPLFRSAQPGSPVARDVWYDTLQADVLMGWTSTVQQPTRLPGRQPGSLYVQSAEFTAWTPLGEPIGWYAMPQAQQLPRPVPAMYGCVSAPPEYSGGASIIVAGPYYVVAQQLYSAGAVAAQVTTQ